MAISVIKCQCGADMLFSPEKGALECPYCGNMKQIARTGVYRRNFFKERSMGQVDHTVASYECPNCRGEIVLEDFQTALACPFCGATNIQKKEGMVGLLPDSILPFKLSNEAALQSGEAWLKKKFFAPSKLKKTFKAENFKGVYVPTFSFTSDTRSAYQGRFGEDYTETVRDKDGNTRTVTKTRWYNVSGSWDRMFSDMIIEASTQVTQKEMGAILPFDVVSAEEYKSEYLSGFMAERYSTSLDDSFGTAKKKMEATIRAEIIRRYNPDRVDFLNVNTSYASVDFSYMLLPVWICGYKFKEKLYHFIVNGRTGKSTGKIPVSVAKVLLVISPVAAAILAVIIYAIVSMVS